MFDEKDTITFKEAKKLAKKEKKLGIDDVFVREEEE